MSTHVLDLLPLWVEGDLPTGEALQVEAHLSGCETCRAAAEALRSSQAWLKEAPGAPFEAADHARFRGEVMASLRQATRKRRAFRLRAALAVAAAALCALLGTLRSRGRTADLPAPTVARTGPTSPVLPPQPAQGERTRHPSARRRPEAPVRPLPALARIDLQTSNPQIRIIWLPPQTAPTEPSRPL